MCPLLLLSFSINTFQNPLSLENKWYPTARIFFSCFAFPFQHPCKCMQSFEFSYRPVKSATCLSRNSRSHKNLKHENYLEMYIFLTFLSFSRILLCCTKCGLQLQILLKTSSDFLHHLYILLHS